MGGLVGRTNEIHEWLKVSVVWVAEDKRRQGTGRHLMRLAEEEAKRRGCRYARLAKGHFIHLTFAEESITMATEEPQPAPRCWAMQAMAWQEEAYITVNDRRILYDTEEHMLSHNQRGGDTCTHLFFKAARLIALRGCSA